MIIAGAVVGNVSHVGEGAIVNAAVVVDRHARAGDFTHLGVDAGMAGGVVQGALAWLHEGPVLRASQKAASGSVTKAS